MRDPLAAGALDPETGASRNRPSLDVTDAFIRFMSASASVAQSTILFPEDTPARIPFEASNTALLASGVES